MRRTPESILKFSRRVARAAAGRSLTRRFAAALTALLLLAFALPAFVPVVRQVEAQNQGGAVNELIPTGSLVIAMDNTRQNLGSTPFNLVAYGVVTRLLHAGIPVKWAIQAGKAKDGTDFTVNAQRIYPSAVASASQSFSGGPFVVHRDFAVAARNVVGTYATTNNVAVYETTADVTASIRHTLTHKPKVAVFNDGASATIHTTYLNAAGFTSGTHYDVIGAATVLAAGTCYTIGTEPHWGATGTAANAQTQAVRNFLVSGGNFLAECEGITTYENNAAFGRFQTTTGVVSGNARTGIQYPSPDLPYSQFVGVMADVGGSVRDFQPITGGAYRATAEMHAQSPSGSLGGGQAGILPAKGTVARLAGPAVGGFVFYLGGHEYTTTALDNINGVRMFLNAVMTPSGRPSGCNLSVTTRTISGTVYEDVNGDSQLGDAVARPNVDVRLYQDNNNNGVVDTGDTFLVAAPTDAAGQYSFQVATQATGNNYLVVVDSKDITPSAGLIVGRGDTWAEQTYGDDPTTAALNLGSRFGGRQSAVSDNFNQASTTPANNTYEHMARVDATSGNVSDVNFAFSFNVVTTTRGGDNTDDDTASATRTVQGSLRQFIQNANATNGANQMRFVPAVAENAGTYWRVTVTTALPAVIDPSTTLDGTAYNNANGTALRDTNTGSMGLGGTVGVQSLTLPQVQRPELEVFDNAGIAVGLDLQAASCVVRRFAVYGFGTVANNDAHGNIRVGNVAGALVEENVLGSSATSFTDPGAATRSVGDNVRVVNGDGGTIQNNLIGFTNGKGIQLSTGANGWLIQGNEVRDNGILNSNLDGIDIENGSNTATVRGNLFTGNEACGIDMYQSSGSNTIENNTVRGNGVGAGANIESPGVRVYGTGTVIRLNIINANFGAGVMVNTTSTNNFITRNSIYANGTITNKASAAASNQIGIDLQSAADSLTVGTPPYVTINDSGDGDAGSNGLLNFPVITQARVLAGGQLSIQGYSRPNADIEFFIAAADASGFGEGQTYLLTLTEGSAADTDAATGTYTSPVNGLNVGTDTTNLFSFTIALPTGVAVGTVLTATATASNNTSEFSGNVTVAAAPPSVSLVKACTVPADCTRPEGHVPGTDLTFRIDYSNVGASPAQTFVLTDPVPANTDFKLGSVTTDLGTTGLTVSVVYSNDNGANYTYTPASGGGGAPAGYDRTVTHVRWNFTGNLPDNSPNNAGFVTFVVRIR